MSPKVRLWFFAVLFLLLAGCGPPRAGEIAWRNPEVDLVWPEPPETARIRFLRTLDPKDFIEQEGRASRFFRWVTGEKAQVLPLVNPYGVAADGEGRVWVADPGLRVVHAFDLARGRVDYLFGVGEESFSSPVGVAYDKERSRLYVSDSVLAKVFVLDDRGAYLQELQSPKGFKRPAGLTTDAVGNLYVVDVLNDRIEVFYPDGSFRRSLESAAPDGKGFNRPSNVWVDGEGRVYVTDSMNFRIEILGPGGEFLGTIGQLGDVPGTFARPRGIAVDSEGHIYVADAAFDNIQVFDRSGNLLLVFGEPGKASGQFSLPSGLFIDDRDRLYVADSFNFEIDLFQYLALGGRGG